jgi:hypothetical protein
LLHGVVTEVNILESNAGYGIPVECLKDVSQCLHPSFNRQPVEQPKCLIKNKRFHRVSLPPEGQRVWKVLRFIVFLINLHDSLVMQVAFDPAADEQGPAALAALLLVDLTCVVVLLVERHIVVALSHNGLIILILLHTS